MIRSFVTGFWLAIQDPVRSALMHPQFTSNKTQKMIKAFNRMLSSLKKINADPTINKNIAAIETQLNEQVDKDTDDIKRKLLTAIKKSNNVKDIIKTHPS